MSLRSDYVSVQLRSDFVSVDQSLEGTCAGHNAARAPVDHRLRCQRRCPYAMLTSMMKKDSVTLRPPQQQRLQALNQVLAGHWTVEEAATVLDISVRQVWRLKAAYLRDGADAFVHGNRGRPSPDKLPEDLCAQIVRLAQERYPLCNITHMAELLALHDQIFVKRDRLRRILQAAGVRPGCQRRAPKHRRRRDRARLRRGHASAAGWQPSCLAGRPGAALHGAGSHR